MPTEFTTTVQRRCEKCNPSPDIPRDANEAASALLKAATSIAERISGGEYLQEDLAQEAQAALLLAQAAESARASVNR